MSNSGSSKSKRGDIYLSEKSGTRVQNNEIHNERRTPDVRNSVLLRDLSGKLYVRKSNVSFRSKYDEPYCRNKDRGKGSWNGMDEPVPNPFDQHGVITIHKCIMQLVVTKGKRW